MRPLRMCSSALALIAATCLVAGCGGSTSSPRRSAGTVSLLMATAPNSLDPAVGSTPEALEADWLVYTPLLTYYHGTGAPGTQLMTGLVTVPPTVSGGGRIYSLSLRPGLVYSDGQPVRASDFRWAVERAIKLGWRSAPQLLTSRIAGAAAFAAGRAKTISGITTDDATGAITIRLTAPWGPFENVLALPATAPVPSSTPLRNEASDPPPGLGPYVFGPIVPGHSFSVRPNPGWHRGTIPGIPSGQVDVSVRITGDPQSDALAVLNNTADVFDAADRIPAALIPRIVRRAHTRYSKQALDTTDLIFMDVRRKPFSSRLARMAVQTGLDENTLKHFGVGLLQEGCFLLPPTIYGHPHNQCPGGNIAQGGNLAAAKALVARSGTAGTRITVWGEASAPSASWMTYYTSLLNRIGFQAQLKLVAPESYFSTIGTLALHPQTGFGELTATVPNPLGFYQPLTAPRSIGNQDWGEIDDAYVNRQVQALGAVPASELTSVASFWHDLDDYVADHAYLAVFGYQTAPEFVSDRLDYARLVFSPVAGLDYTSFRLK